MWWGNVARREQGWAGTKAPFTVLQAQGGITWFPLAALASLFGGVGWGRFVLVADTSRDHTRERRKGGSVANTRGTEEERQGQETEASKEKGEQRLWVIGTRKEAGWARPQTETEFRPRRIQRENQRTQQSDRDDSGEGRPETRLRYRILKRMVWWTEWEG